MLKVISAVCIRIWREKVPTWATNAGLTVAVNEFSVAGLRFLRRITFLKSGEKCANIFFLPQNKIFHSYSVLVANIMR